MSVKSSQSVTVEFTTENPSTGAAQNGDSTPTGILYVDGTANGATCTVSNITTGVYKVAVTLPTLTAGQMVGIRISATVAAVAGTAVVWQDTADTSLVSDVAQLLRNKVVTNPATGVMTIYADNGTDVLFSANVYEDVAGSSPYVGHGANRRDRLA